MRKPHFREWEGKKVTNRPRTVGLPVGFADNRNQGIVFRSDGNTELVTHYDSGFAPDPVDGKSTFGHVINCFGGPVSWLSKKLPHVGTHVGQNETAAQCFAGKHTACMKHVHEEVEQKEHPPVAVLGDDDQATNFSQEGAVLNTRRPP
jgi:hypothetical protein